MTIKAAQALPKRYQYALSFIRRTPLSRGGSRQIIINWFKQHIDYPIITDFRNVPFILTLDNTTEAKALFGRYNLQELDFLKRNTACADPVFVDLGANSGFYTQNFLAYHHDGTVIAIEPNPAMCDRIKRNYALLKKGNLIVECCAAGEGTGEMELDLSNGFGSAHITSQKSKKTIPVKIESLRTILQRHMIKKIDVMKIDIEGYEDRALIPFFTNADPALFPRHIIIEHTSSDSWEHDLFTVLKNKGYTPTEKTRGNLLLTKTGV